MSAVDLWRGDCLVEMNKIPDGSVDMICTDLPYGTTACSWDTVIPFEPMWEQFKRVIKSNGAIVLFATQPFTSLLIASNLKMFKYNWVWEKSRPGGFVSAKLKPLKATEDICVFSFGTTANCAPNNMCYYPQGLVPSGKSWKRPKKYEGSEGVNYSRPSHELERKLEYTNYPRNIIKFNNPNKEVLHPTQKPVELLEYLIKTYTLEGETVLDATMGSGSTGVACVSTNRNFIGIEKELKYFDVASKIILS